MTNSKKELQMRKTIPALFCAATLTMPALAFTAPKTEIPALEAFARCSFRDMPQAPVNIGKGLSIIRIEHHPYQIHIWLNRSAKKPDTIVDLVHRTTGYDFGYGSWLYGKFRKSGNEYGIKFDYDKKGLAPLLICDREG